MSKMQGKKIYNLIYSGEVVNKMSKNGWLEYAFLTIFGLFIMMLLFGIVEGFIR